MPISTSASERAFVGAVINGDARAAEHGLVCGDFSDSFCRQLFSLCLQLEAQGKLPDIVTLSDMIDDVDLSALIELTQEASVIGALANQHAANIRSAAQRREFADACLKAARDAQNGSLPLEDVQNTLRALIERSDTHAAGDDFTTGEDAIVDFLMWLDSNEPDISIPIGIPGIDAKLHGGLKAGQLCVIGARTGVGKSALMSFATANAIKAGKRVLIVSLEMPDRQNMGRMFARMSDVDLSRIVERNTLSDTDRYKIIEACQLLPGKNFRFSTQAKTPGAIRRQALRMRAQGGLDMIVVDYIQIMDADSRASSRAEAIGRNTMALKLLAMELGVPILTAAQINRAGVQGNSVPRLSDLRESGSIEQDADVVLLMHRPDGQERERCKRIELLIAKQREGELGMVELVYDGAHMRFAQIDRHFDEAG